MAFRSTPSFVAKTALLTLVLGSFSLLGCEAYKNYDERKAAAEKAGQNIDYSCMNGDCVEDPGSRLLSQEDCTAAENGYEFMPIPIMDNEHVRDKLDANGQIVVDANGKGETEYFALHSYTYDDDTTQSLQPFGWEPSAIEDPWKRCGKANNHVLTLKGGPFLEWGGGIGRSLRCINGSKQAIQDAMVPYNEYWLAKLKPEFRTDKKEVHKINGVAALDNIYCHVGTGRPAQDPTSVGACSASQTDPLVQSVCPERDKKVLADPTDVTEQELPLVGVTLDLSAWEGISFWARRGPNSQPGLRVLVGDKATDDDISFAQTFVDPNAEPYCRRTFECACKDKNAPCTIVTDVDIAAYDANVRKYWNKQPDSNNLTPMMAGDGVCWDPETGEMGIDRIDYQYCGQSACVHQSDSAKSLNAVSDPFIYGTECREYSFRGGVTSKFCFDPKSEFAIQRQPTEPSQTCGDHWMYSVRLSYDWEFYTVPFTKLLQQGWAKRSYWLDLKAISLMRFTWDRGYVDFYIDDVRFYRKKK